jgi:hypothetical protein
MPFAFDAYRQVVAALRNTAGHDRVNLEFFGDLSYVCVLSFVPND